ASQEVGEEKRKEKEALRLQLEQEQEEKKIAREKRAEKDNIVRAKVELAGPKTIGKIDLDAGRNTAQPLEPVKEEEVVAAEKVPEPPQEVVVEKVVEKEVEKIVETPKVEVETKIVAPINEEVPAPKVEEPKVEEPKVEQPKVVVP